MKDSSLQLGLTRTRLKNAPQLLYRTVSLQVEGLFFEASAGLVRLESPPIKSLDSRVCFVGEPLAAACAYGRYFSNQRLLVDGPKPAVSDDNLAIDQNRIDRVPFFTINQLMN
jgi:hypothetical protein